jgi:hypothetical protein
MPPSYQKSHGNQDKPENTEGVSGLDKFAFQGPKRSYNGLDL